MGSCPYHILAFHSPHLTAKSFSFSSDFILADLISFLEIQRSLLTGSSSTVFAVNLILY